jgi:imidazole glycerol-phosphate synthase subunit HisH
MVTIIDYGLGNLGSIKNMMSKIGTPSQITNDLELIKNATKLILPGVGAFDNGMENLQAMNVIALLNHKILVEKTPILGICLGMQLFTKSSEEGQLPGLGWIDAETLKFDTSKTERKFTIPHMGWEFVKQEKNSKLLTEMYEESKYYFVHSYYVKSNVETDVLLTTDYINQYVSGFEKENILGVQFHPEKSHKFGMKLFKNFVENY